MSPNGQRMKKKKGLSTEHASEGSPRHYQPLPRSRISSRELGPILAAREKGRGQEGNRRGRGRQRMDELHGSSTSSFLLLHVASLHFPFSPNLDFQWWEGFGFTNVPKEIFCGSSISITQPHKHRMLGVLTRTESPRSNSDFG